MNGMLFIDRLHKKNRIKKTQKCNLFIKESNDNRHIKSFFRNQWIKSI
ncbi:hypothetical protein NWE61_02260 [Mycoplasmopsis felis]|nr:hypothetical protein [Mycoplasmopsis felis]MCU9934013.1 hypothetical protein [Mycoplasmopsis felis]